MKQQYLGLFAITAVSAGCSQFEPPTGSAGPSTGDATSCAYVAMVEDAEDGDDQTLTRAGRGGYLYTYMDENGTSIEPAGDFTPTDGGANGSAKAMRMQGRLGEGAEVYAGMGFSFMEPKGTYDASRFTGIAFTARRGSDSIGVARVKLPDAATDPDGGACTDCYNDFGVSVQLTEEWTRYEVAFADLQQEVGWGNPRPSTVDASKLYGIQFQVAQSGAAFDVWVDDISFTGCDVR